MTSRRAVYDTNVILRHRLSAVPGFVSAVVLQELTAGARDTAEVRRLGRCGPPLKTMACF